MHKETMGRKSDPSLSVTPLSVRIFGLSHIKKGHQELDHQCSVFVVYVNTETTQAMSARELTKNID